MLQPCLLNLFLQSRGRHVGKAWSQKDLRTKTETYRNGRAEQTERGRQLEQHTKQENSRGARGRDHQEFENCKKDVGPSHLAKLEAERQQEKTGGLCKRWMRTGREQSGRGEERSWDFKRGLDPWVGQKMETTV